MNWYRENPWLGNFLLAVGTAILLALWLLWHAKRAFAGALAEFNIAAAERTRLEHLNPFPDEENFQKARAALDSYSASLNKLKDELGGQVLPATLIAPHEFQTRLRQAIVSIIEKARVNHVRLPENFHLGFDEFTAALPNTDDAVLLGQELRQFELLLGILIDSKVDAITDLKRVVGQTQTIAAATSQKKTLSVPNAARSNVEHASIDLTFAASASALRKVLNQIASCDRQFFIVRTLYVRNEQVTGPPRKQSAANAVGAAATLPNALKFIVGNEHVETTATIEILRFSF